MYPSPGSLKVFNFKISAYNLHVIRQIPPTLEGDMRSTTRHIHYIYIICTILFLYIPLVVYLIQFLLCV